jgi:hypothetical protein
MNLRHGDASRLRSRRTKRAVAGTCLSMMTRQLAFRSFTIVCSLLRCETC